ncbi:MAG TPA: gluconate 2-dehydrogenase subunit 3 family protein [Polyangiaceae bacterium]|jgi:hypothetical protein|nr:gluconate 2-dehydrogenase subunit 3 family protein [Polyangiaceae bacterium]
MREPHDIPQRAEGRADPVAGAKGGVAAQRGISRRRVLQAGALAMLAIGGATAAVRSSGYFVPEARRLLAMSSWQFVVVQHAARRIAAPDREGDPSIPTADALDVAGFVDGWLSRMAPALRRDFGRFLAYVEHLAPLSAGVTSRFTRLAPAAQDRVLSAIEASSIDLLRAGFDGLKSLVLMGYYRDERAWAIVGYDGPLVGRPEGGWTPARPGQGGAGGG